MLNKDSLKILKVPELRLFCKNVKIKINKLTKLELFENYNRYLAVKCIQKNYRKHFYREAECSITLEKVSYPCFIYRTKFGKLFFYDYLSIVKYISKTGNTHDPMTREQYSDNDLVRLDSSLKKHFPDQKFSSTLKIKRNIDYAKRVRDRENDIITYQTLLNETKMLIVNLIESGILVSGINENIQVGNETFISTDEYVLYLLDKINVIYDFLKGIDLFWANSFKIDFLDTLKQYDINVPEIRNVYDFIVLI
jgi:hypothetical protein